jgi:hypothetical protein
MQPHTVRRSATVTWTSTPVHFNGREFRRIRFSNGVRVTLAVWERKSASICVGSIIARRRPS